MNKERRKRIAKALNLIEEERSILEEVMDEEQEAFDNLPESLQESAKGEVMEEAIGIMEDFLDGLETEDLEEIAEEG